jgi:hypothetical protein
VQCSRARFLTAAAALVWKKNSEVAKKQEIPGQIQKIYLKKTVGNSLKMTYIHETQEL